MLLAGRYCISSCAQRLLALMHAAVAKACHCGDHALAKSLCQAVADAAALKAALPPQIHARQLQVRDPTLWGTTNLTPEPLKMLNVLPIAQAPGRAQQGTHARVAAKSQPCNACAEYRT